MKKIFSFVLVLILLFCAAMPGFADNDDLLERIYVANSGDTLRATHESRLIHISRKDQADTIIYSGLYYEVFEDPDYLPGIRVRSSEYDYVAMEEGGFRRFIQLEMEDDSWVFFTMGFLDMEVVSAEEDGETLVVTVSTPENYATDYFPEAVETREVSVVDANTLEMKSYRALAVMPDGSEEVFYEAEVEFDVDPIHQETIDALEKHLYEDELDTRTTTFIFDDDKPCKRTYVFETPVGDGCLVANFVDGGYEYEIDPERSISSNEAFDNDAVYYMNRIDPEA